MLRFSGAGVSEVGHVREHNEDSGFVAPYIALVADGVGGAAAGEVASATAAYVVSAMALARDDHEPLERVIREAVAATRLSLADGVREDSDREGMATTLTALLCDGDRVLLAHLGDSRAFHYREGGMTQLSRDHTYVQMLVDTGQLRAEDVATHPWRNVVLRSLHATLDPGVDLDLGDVDLVETDARVGDRFLLCSDGLTDFVPASRIRDLLRLRDPQAAATMLTHAALRAGGRDNITCVVVDVVDGPRVVGDGRLLGAFWDFRNVVDPACVHRT